MALRPILNRIWASTNPVTRRDPGTAKYVIGWTSEIPTFQVLNYLQFKVDTTLLAFAERGIPEWGSDVTYAKGALAWNETNATIYVCLVANPDKTKRPDQNAAQWTISSVQTPRADYDTAKANWVAHIANVTGNPHALTPGRLNAYTKAETDALIKTYTDLVATHANDKNNPHKTTAAQIGAVPITGGTYTGDVTFGSGKVLFDAAKAYRIGILSGGFWMQNGADNTDYGVLGFNNAGAAQVGTKTSQSNIVTEATFAAQKALTENKYASPAPDWFMPLINTANIFRGGNYSLSSDANVAYSASAGWSSWRGLYPVNLLIDGGVTAKTPLDGSTTCTIAIDIWYNGKDVAPIGPGGNRVIIGFGNSPGRSLIAVANDGNGNRSVQGYGGSAVGVNRYSITDNSPHRFVWVRTATTQQLFVDGVPAGPVQTGMANVAISGNYQLIRSESSPNSGGEVQCLMSNFRAWRVALTPEQVSAL